jgi:hypothetical protein
MPSQETDHVSPTEVTPELGKEALGTWRPSRPYGGRLDKTGAHAGYGFRRRGCGQTGSDRGAREPALKPLHALGRPTDDTPGLQTGPGKSGRPAL